MRLSYAIKMALYDVRAGHTLSAAARRWSCSLRGLRRAQRRYEAAKAAGIDPLAPRGFAK